MIRTIAKEIKEYKWASIATPLFMLLEVLMETLIPYLMASIIDKGVNAGDGSVLRTFYDNGRTHDGFTRCRIGYGTSYPLILCGQLEAHYQHREN